jgi:peptide/nickel transport system permease protein
VTQYIIKRLLFSVLVLFLISLVVFTGVRVIPGDVCAIVAGDHVTPEQCATIERNLGLDEPAPTQYLKWVGGILRGDFGTSFQTRSAVWPEIQNRIPVTVQLTVLSTGFALALALPIGVYSAIRQDRFADYFLRIMTIGWLSIPNFWLGAMLIVLFSSWFGYISPLGYKHIWEDPLLSLEQHAMAAFALGLALSASLARITRSAMLEVLRQDYIRTARAKGMREAVVVNRHALRNAMIPVITLFGLQFGVLFGGTVIIETIFNLPGLGRLLLRSVVLKDFPAVQGLVILFAVVLVMVNLIVDISYAWFDPRIRYS